ncbi:MAG: nucleoside deaminase [Candidatus Adiutrix sp.]|nr:nucleoside deaminase [Candidatus Adiutrix sp.]
MEEALREAALAAALGEVPAGAVLADPEGRLVGRGRNQVLTLADPTAHAEILAIREAALKAGNYRLTGHLLVSTLEPCPMCLMAAIHARVGQIIFGAPEPRWGAAGSLVDLTELAGLNHRPLVRGGLKAEAARDLMTSFFQARRQG